MGWLVLNMQCGDNFNSPFYFPGNSSLQFTKHCLRKKGKSCGSTKYNVNATSLRNEPALTTFFAFSASQETIIQANLGVSLFQSKVITRRK